jgi:hypothetical protein
MFRLPHQSTPLKPFNMVLHHISHLYEPLMDRHIRLLELLDLPNGDQPYELIETSLDFAPPYETLSHVWGEQEKCQVFTSHAGKSAIITPLLHNTLAHLRRHCQTRYLWVDQICID